LIQYEVRKKEMFKLKKAPRILQKRTSRMMIIRYYTVKEALSLNFGARGSYVSEFEMEDCDLVQLGKQWSTRDFFQIP
jgi:hypothetical protein